MRVSKRIWFNVEWSVNVPILWSTPPSQGVSSLCSKAHREFETPGYPLIFECKMDLSERGWILPGVIGAMMDRFSFNTKGQRKGQIKNRRTPAKIQDSLYIVVDHLAVDTKIFWQRRSEDWS